MSDAWAGFYHRHNRGRNFLLPLPELYVTQWMNETIRTRSKYTNFEVLICSFRTALVDTSNILLDFPINWLESIVGYLNHLSLLCLWVSSFLVLINLVFSPGGNVRSRPTENQDCNEQLVWGTCRMRSKLGKVAWRRRCLSGWLSSLIYSFSPQSYHVIRFFL